MTGSLTTIRPLCSAHNSALFSVRFQQPAIIALHSIYWCALRTQIWSYGKLCCVTAESCSVCNIIAADSTAQTGCRWHRLQPSHAKYKKLHSLALITTSDKQNWLHLPSQRTTPSWEHLYCACWCHYEPHIPENIPFPLVRDSNLFVVYWRWCLKIKMETSSGRVTLVWEKRH